MLQSAFVVVLLLVWKMVVLREHVLDSSDRPAFVVDLSSSVNDWAANIVPSYGACLPPCRHGVDGPLIDALLPLLFVACLLPLLFVACPAILLLGAFQWAEFERESQPGSLLGVDGFYETYGDRLKTFRDAVERWRLFGGWWVLYGVRVPSLCVSLLPALTLSCLACEHRSRFYLRWTRPSTCVFASFCLCGCRSPNPLLRRFAGHVSDVPVHYVLGHVDACTCGCHFSGHARPPVPEAGPPGVRPHHCADHLYVWSASGVVSPCKVSLTPPRFRCSPWASVCVPLGAWLVRGRRVDGRRQQSAVRGPTWLPAPGHRVSVVAARRLPRRRGRAVAGGDAVARSAGAAQSGRDGERPPVAAEVHCDFGRRRQRKHDVRVGDGVQAVPSVAPPHHAQTPGTVNDPASRHEVLGVARWKRRIGRQA